MLSLHARWSDPMRLRFPSRTSPLTMKATNFHSLAAAVAVALIVSHASSHGAVLLAGFYDSGTDNTVTGLAANTTATDIAATFDGRGRQSGTNNYQSTDATYGSTLSGAPTALPTVVPFAAVYRSNVDNTFTITNNSLSDDVSIETIAFDFHNNDNPSRDYFDIVNLIYLSGDLTGIAGNTTLNTWNSIPRHTGTISIVDGDWQDFDFSLTSLSDYTLAPGESASFRISSASTDTALSNNQNFGALDNIGFIGTIGAVPEPHAALLGGLGLLLLLRRRRHSS